MFTKFLSQFDRPNAVVMLPFAAIMFICSAPMLFGATQYSGSSDPLSIHTAWFMACYAVFGLSMAGMMVAGSVKRINTLVATAFCLATTASLLMGSYHMAVGYALMHPLG